MLKPQAGWTFADWRHAYASGELNPGSAIRSILSELDLRDKTWIQLANETLLQEQLMCLPHIDSIPSSMPLYGIPFVVKDNIDVAHWNTTAACPEFSYTARADAPAVAILKAAGAIVIAKTNMDQFATGLVGVRSPYGIPVNPFDALHVPGGSSSGSAVAVARGIVPFSLGTDTAGSGRVPAGFNNIVGWKPTRGLVSSRGVVPACRTLDCVSVFALHVSDAHEIGELISQPDPQDPYSRPALANTPLRDEDLCIGIPASLEWFGDDAQAEAWKSAVEIWKAMGARIETVDFEPMHQLAALLYGPWVAERTATLEQFMAKHSDTIHPVVHSILAKGATVRATDFCQAEYLRAELGRVIRTIASRYTALVVPTAPRFPTIAAVLADPIVVNTQLGTWTNFVNLSDCCALALPAPFRPDGLPAGITLIAPHWHDDHLACIGKKWEQALGDRCLGATQKKIQQSVPTQYTKPDSIAVAVVGAHLTGMPLNHQLTSRGGRLLCTTTTSPHYRLYALPRTTPPKPGLFRCNTSEKGACIAIEVWQLPLAEFGSFVAEVPPPLAIGSIELADGSWCKGFVCEAHAIADAAEEITVHGGWKSWLGTRKS